MKYKILQLISSAGQFGAENVMLELSSALIELGHDVTIGIFYNKHTPNTDLIEAVKRRGMPFEVFECGGKIDFKTVYQIAKYIRRQRTDLVHCHGYKSNIYACLANIFARKKLITTCHNWINSSSKMSFYSFLDKKFITRFDRVVSVSLPVKEALIDAGVKEKNVHLISNGIDIQTFALGPNVDCFAGDMPEGVTRIGCVGRISEEKGLDYLLNAAHDLLKHRTDCHFVIVGDGPLLDSLKEQAARLDILDYVHFTGRRADIPEVLASLDIFAMPSLTEGQPMALLEAMASGLPIIASAVGDIPKILKNGELGIIIPPADTARLTEAILTYLDSPLQASEMSDRARRAAEEQYSSARMAREYEEVYEALVRN